MPSTAIVGESVFFESARVLNASNRISYYQYKALESLLEILTLHDRATLLIGEETDIRYLQSFDSLVNAIHQLSDFKIDFLRPNDRAAFITPDVMLRFEQICRELYPYPLGVTSDDLFSKQPKDRTAEDMAEHLEQLFSRDYPRFDGSKFGEDLYDLWLKNGNSSELLYFFRGHLIQAIAETQEFTPIHENQRLITSIFQHVRRKNNRVGNLPYAIYQLADNLFIKSCSELPPEVKKSYPRTSIGMHFALATLNTRADFLKSVLQLRERLQDFRQSYTDFEEVLTNPDESLAERANVQSHLKANVDLVWLPLMSSLGHGYTSNKIKKVAKGVFGKYGIGDVKVEESSKPGANESTTSFSTSLVGVAAALTQTLADIRNDSRLVKPNQSLIDILLKVVNMSGTREKLARLLPIRDFVYKTPQLIDSLIFEA